MNIFVPNDNIYNQCYEVLDNDTIRAYDTIPNTNTLYGYRDYFIHSDYMYRDGVGEWSSSDTLPICLDENIITHDEFYRVDFPYILLDFSIMFFFIIVIPLFICSKFFYRR